MNISFEEIGHLSVTLPACQCHVGLVCKVAPSGQAAACISKEAICGVVEAIRGETAAVQIHGFVTQPYTGTAPVPGWCGLAANGTGGVQVEAAAHKYLVVRVDTGKKHVTFEL